MNKCPQCGQMNFDQDTECSHCKLPILINKFERRKPNHNLPSPESYNDSRWLILLGLLIVGGIIYGVTIGSEKETANADIASTQSVNDSSTKEKIVDMPMHEISYKLFKDKNNGGSCVQYYAVIRKLNPAKDDYKAYCRYIIDDVIKQNGNNKVLIDIYDNLEAYKMEVKQKEGPEIRQGDTGPKIVQRTKNNLKFIDAHTVAAYGGDMGAIGEGSNFHIYYYESDERYKGSEEFKP